MRQKLFKLLVILIIGGLGGVLADQFFLPYLAGLSIFSKIGFIQKAKDGTTIINKTEKIIIAENTALEEAIRRVSPSLAVVQVWAKQKVIREGTAFIIFSDGLFITAADLVSGKGDKYAVIRDGSQSAAQVIKKDLENNLALLKTEETNLPVVSLADFEGLALGQRVILMAVKAEKNNFYRFVNTGTIRGLKPEEISLNLEEENPLANGGPLIDVKGEVIGLNLINQKGLKTAPVNKIREFISRY